MSEYRIGERVRHFDDTATVVDIVRDQDEPGASVVLVQYDTGAIDRVYTDELEAE